MAVDYYTGADRGDGKYLLPIKRPMFDIKRINAISKIKGGHHVFQRSFGTYA
jgi:hypothetical protein